MPVAAVTAGGVASILIAFVVYGGGASDGSLPSTCASCPRFGPGIWIAGSQPVDEMIGESGSLTDQCTTTKLPLVFPRYQPFVPTMPSIE